ncbi:MAG: outer membrane protein assembly factor BamD, partial [Chlorobiaceae bacterium]|nr:outer membrane protein assembly factor BamD [Chlorobiaceae bacterium]
EVKSASTKIKESYDAAQALYAKRKYDDASMKLESLLFTSRGTALEDDVLFLLGQTYYQSKQYLLSADMYGRLLQQLPSSPYAKTAQFMLARSHEKLSPHHELDQEHTAKAVNEYELYRELYPVPDSAKYAGDVEMYTQLLKVNPDNQSYRQGLAAAKSEYRRLDSLNYAAKTVPVLREKLAKHSFTIAKTYIQLKKYRAAGIFFDEVIVKYPETIYAPLAWKGKIDVLMKRKKWFDASQTIDQYLQLYPSKEKEMRGEQEKIKSNLHSK